MNSNSTERKPSQTDKIVQQLNVFLIIALVVIPTAFIALKINNVGWIIFAIFGALFFNSIDKIKVFKLYNKLINLEAEMHSAIGKTYAALEELKELALALSEPMIVNLAMSGKMLEFIRLEYKLESVEKITNVLHKLGASKKEIDEACGFIYKRVEKNHIRNILTCLRPENWQESEIFKGFGDWDFQEWDKAKIEKFVKENSLELNDEANEWMSDLDYFMQTNKLQRPDKWQS